MLVAHMREDGLDAVMAARASLLADADRTAGDIHIVMADDEVLRLQFIKMHERPERPSALIHIRLRLHEEHFLRAAPHLRDQRLTLLLPRRHAPARRQCIHEHKPHIMFRLGILPPGIAQPRNNLHLAAPFSKHITILYPLSR